MKNPRTASVSRAAEVVIASESFARREVMQRIVIDEAFRRPSSRRVHNRGMKAIQLDAPGPPDALHVRDLPLPEPPDGWVRIRIESFGINRSELHLRHGLATNATFPRVPGIECAGTIDDPAGTSFARGQKVVAMMGGMGRAFDGGYAQFTVVPASQVIAIETELPWEIVGAV